MDVSVIIDDARTRSHTDSDDYADALAVRHLNLIYERMVDEIVVITKWDYFWDKWTANTVIGQSEYLATKLWIAPNDLDIKKINKVFIKYDSADTYYTRARYQPPHVLEYHPEYYEDNQSEADPFFYIQDNSIFIYPAPTAVVTAWIEIFCIHTPAELTISSTEADIEIPKQFHDAMVWGLMSYIYNTQWKLNEASYAEQRFEAKLNSMAQFMKQRYNQPVNRTFSNLNSYR